MTEADTCRIYILPKLHTANWDDEYIVEQLVLTPGRIVRRVESLCRRQAESARQGEELFQSLPAQSFGTA